MELDELKGLWAEQSQQKINFNIMETITNPKEGPLVKLKRSYRKQVTAMAILPMVLILTNANSLTNVFSSVMFWTYVFFCICMVCMGSYNFMLVRRMQVMHENLKDHLTANVDLLERRAKLEINLLRFFLLLFIALAEIMPYVQDYRMLRLWHEQPVTLRIAVYAGLIFLQYKMNRKVRYRKVGQHLERMRMLVAEMK